MLPNALGWIGMGLLLFAFARRNKLAPTTYETLNLVGSILTLVICVHQRAWPPAVLNAAWGAIAAWGLWVRMSRAGDQTREVK